MCVVVIFRCENVPRTSPSSVSRQLVLLHHQNSIFLALEWQFQLQQFHQLSSKQQAKLSKSISKFLRFCHVITVEQWLERWTDNLTSVGSSLAGAKNFFFTFYYKFFALEKYFSVLCNSRYRHGIANFLNNFFGIIYCLIAFLAFCRLLPVHSG